MIGFDIGGTKCAVCVGEERGGTLALQDKRVIPTDLSVSPHEMLDRMCALADEMTDHAGRIGISCGGPLNSAQGVILSPPNLPGWDHVQITSYLENRYGVKAYLQNDANACAVAEWKYGAGRGCRNMIFLTFGTGMGAGLILNGRLYAGSSDMAGEIGHVRMAEYGPVGYGKAGSFEGFCSGSGIAQLGQMAARESIQRGEAVSFCSGPDALERITAKTIAECAERGCEDARAVYRRCGEMLGRGLAVLIDVLNPERIVLGSIYRRSGHLLREAMQQVIDRECLPAARGVCSIVPAQLGEKLGDYAALAVAAMEGESQHAV
ncbi:MAG: ROK family protein [Hominenteromicrobium sp.]